MLRLRLIASDSQSREITVSATSVRLGRDSRCEVRFDSKSFPSVSGIHAFVKIIGGAATLTPLSVTNSTLLNGKPIAGPTFANVGDRIQLGASGPLMEIIEFADAAEAPADETPAKVVESTAPPRATVQADAADLALLRGSVVGEHLYALQPESIIGRDRDHVQIHLNHPHVSRKHAVLIVTDDQAVLDDLKSANGTYVNGLRIVAPVALRRGDRIDIGPFSLAFEDGALVSRSRSNNIELIARGVNRIVRDRGSGLPLSLLHGVNLIVQPREFVCLLGPSGSGKSTLLTILSGRRPPDGGSIAINGLNLYQHFDALKQEIAVVPQKDMLHDSLAVAAALRYTAQLRLPPDTGRDEIESAVTDILEVVGLSERRHTLIRHLSGGQVKRASLANELIARPSLIFLDEVTSGLDEQTDREMMELFRRVADGGKTVVCITHNLTNVDATCKLVVILTERGRLAFVGTPAEAKSYFGIQRLGDVYERLETRKPEEWQAEFETSPIYARYVTERMPPATPVNLGDSHPQLLMARHKTPRVGQASVLTQRYLAIWRGNIPALITLLGQSLLVAALLCLVFGSLESLSNPVERIQRTVNLLFLMTVSSFWFGCNTAAKELVKERVIFARECGFNLCVESYLSSKVTVLLMIGLLQVTVLFVLVRLGCGPPGSPFLQWLALVAMMCAGTGMGLLISAVSRTEEVAAALVPIAVIPQIILAGVIAPLTGLAKGIAWVAITCYHGQGGVEALLPDADRALAGLADHTLAGCLLAAAIHAGVFGVLTLILLYRQSRPAAQS
jgi:ABC transport system ATP-binding/permease protein